MELFSFSLCINKCINFMKNINLVLIYKDKCFFVNKRLFSDKGGFLTNKFRLRKLEGLSRALGLFSGTARWF